MGMKNDMDHVTAEEWGQAVASSEFDYDYPDEREELTIERIQMMLEFRKFKELKDELENNMYPVDLADILEEVEEKQLVLVFRLLAKEEAAETFAYMNSDLREVLINALTDSELEEVMEEMYLDDTVDVLEEMPANVVDRLLLATDEEKRVQINQLLQYPEDSAGSVMNVDYIALSMDMTVEEAMTFFEPVPSIKRKIETLYDVGLSYIKLGQPSTTLSGGEAQRIKLATELSRRSTGKTIYILDEPTTGLHFADVHKLVEILQRLAEGGNTIIVIEHNLDVIKTADYIIDIGPEGGDGGGTIIAEGTPEYIASCPQSYTGIYVKRMLERVKR